MHIAVCQWHATRTSFHGDFIRWKDGSGNREENRKMFKMLKAYAFQKQFNFLQTSQASSLVVKQNWHGAGQNNSIIQS